MAGGYGEFAYGSSPYGGWPKAGVGIIIPTGAPTISFAAQPTAITLGIFINTGAPTLTFSAVAPKVATGTNVTASTGAPTLTFSAGSELIFNYSVSGFAYFVENVGFYIPADPNAYAYFVENVGLKNVNLPRWTYGAHAIRGRVYDDTGGFAYFVENIGFNINANPDGDAYFTENVTT
jgi:hypothetical protein